MTPKWFLLPMMCLALVLSVGLTGCEFDSDDDDDDDDDVTWQTPTAAPAEAVTQEQPAEQEQQKEEVAQTVPSGSGQGEGGGFLWKPVSESDGKLVVLLPSSYRGRVKSLSIVAGGAVRDVGRFAGDTHNGNRPHYRFAKSGGSYGSSIRVVAELNGGGSHYWSVPNGSSRKSY